MIVPIRKHTHVIELENGSEEEIAWLRALDSTMEYHPTLEHQSSSINYSVRAYATLSPSSEQIVLLHLKYGELMTVYTLPTLH